MYTSSHSYGPTSLYLEVLRRQWLLDYDDSVKLYKITPKGRQFLELYNKMAKIAGACFLGDIRLVADY